MIFYVKMNTIDGIFKLNSRQMPDFHRFIINGSILYWGNIWSFDKGSHLVCGTVSCGTLASAIISKAGKQPSSEDLATAPTEFWSQRLALHCWGHRFYRCRRLYLCCSQLDDSFRVWKTTDPYHDFKPPRIETKKIARMNFCCQEKRNHIHV